MTWPQARAVAAQGVRFALHRVDPPRRRRTTPALLLHGVPETAYAWRDLAEELGRDRIVLAPDLKGLGGSETCGRYDVPTLVHELAALALHEVPGPIDVVGHDWGGSLALALAGARPELVRRLVVVSAPYRHIDLLHAAHIPFFSLPVLPELAFAIGGDRILRAAFGYAWRASPPPPTELLDRYLAAYAEPARIQAMLSYYRATTRPRLVKLLRRGARPGPPSKVVAERMVIWGAADPVLPLPVGEAAVQDLGPETVFVSLPGVGHFPVEEAPAITVPAIANFLRATTPSA